MSSNSATPRKVRVDLGARSYDVMIGRDLLCDEMDNLFYKREPYASKGAPLNVAIIADKNLKNRDIGWVMDIVIVGYNTYWVDAGEPSKSIAQCESILRWLADEKLGRTDMIIAYGGGVIGDLAGFVAATYLRGVAYVQVPTTLLAMVDSSVGGKTGVNLPEGKNLVGAFHQPRLVVADLDTLETLPPREFAAGMAEVIKYGVIADGALFDRAARGVKPTDPDLADIVARCVEIKARIVEKDEFETKGERALLNFGHTIGHAIEKATGYTRYLHGEAISIGMRAAAWLSVWQAGLSESEAHSLEAALVTNHLPVHLDPAVKAEAILSALGNDKKVAADGRNRWVLVNPLGRATSQWELSSDLVQRAVSNLY
jgi:3-dehydroquinate synthase